MIYFKDWEISHDGSILARQYDHLSRVLLVRGTPQGYDWEMRVRADELELTHFLKIERRKILWQ